MKKYVLLVFLLLNICFSNAQESQFWKGEIISSSFSTESYFLIDGFIYSVVGEDWDKKGNIPNGAFTSIDIDSEATIWLFAANEIIFSKNEGNTWDNYDSNIPVYPHFSKIIDDHIYIGSGSKLYRKLKNDTSAEWQLLYEGDSYDDFCAKGDDIYVAKYEFDIIKSSDNGKTWVSMTKDKVESWSSPETIVFNGDNLLIGTYWGGIIYSKDGNESWNYSTGLPEGRGVSKIVVKNEQIIYALVADQISIVGWYQSNDGGENFAPLNFDLSSWTLNHLSDLIFDNDRIIINVGYRGFYYSDNNGKNWHELNNSFNNLKPHHARRIIEDNNGDLWVLSSMGGVPLPWYRGTWGVFKSSDQGETWEEMSGKLSTSYMILEDMAISTSGEVIVSAYDPGKIYRLNKNDLTWQEHEVKLDESMNTSTVELLETGENNVLYAGTFWNGILKSEDFGLTWKVLDYGHPERGVRYIYSEENKIFIVSDDQKGYVGIFYSLDKGDTWTQVNDSDHKFKGFREYQEEFYAYTKTKVYKSTDKGTTWVEFSGDLPINLVINSFEFAKFNSTTKSGTEDKSLFLASDQGVFMNDTKDENWFKVNNNETNYILFSESSNKIHFGVLEEMISSFLGNNNMVVDFTSDPVKKTFIDEQYNYEIQTSALGTNLIFTIKAKIIPDWLSFIDNGNGSAVLNGTTNVAGEYEVILELSDGSSQFVVEQKFIIKVEEPAVAPYFVSNYIENAFQGKEYIYEIEVNDENSNSKLEITASKLPTWLEFKASGDNSATLSGLANDVGEFEVELNVSDGIFNTIQKFLIHVSVYTFIEKNNEAQISIYPNPTSKELNIEFNNIQSKSVDLFLFDLNGKIIIRDRIKSIFGYYKYEKNIEKLESGIYFMFIDIQGKRIKKKLVISN